MMFVTLTSTPYYNEEAFGAGSREWSKWIKKFRRECAKAAGVKKSERDTWKGIKYIKTTETGKKNGHGHIHAIVIADEIPAWWKRDPNRGKAGNKRQIQAVGTLWPYGWTNCAPIRFIGDRWQREHQWDFPTPMRKKMKRRPDGKAEEYYGRTRDPINTIDKCTRYLLKYETKQEATEWKTTRTTKKLTRTITSRGLGQEIINQLAEMNQSRREWSARRWSASLPSRKTLNLTSLRNHMRMDWAEQQSDEFWIRRANRIDKRNTLKKEKRRWNFKDDFGKELASYSTNSQGKERFYKAVKQWAEERVTGCIIEPPEAWLRRTTSGTYKSFRVGGR